MKPRYKPFKTAQSKGPGSISSTDLRQRLIAHHNDLPPQLKRIAQFVLDQPQQAALMRIAEIATALDVQPSAVIRFSKAVGFGGFAEIQKILRADLAGTGGTYFDRLQSGASADGPLARFAELGAVSLQNLPDQVRFETAVQMLCEAETIHVLGLRRAFGVAAYFAYLLSGFEARVNQIEFLGHMNQASLSTVRRGDLLFVISFPDYSEEVLEALVTAKQRGTKIIALTNSEVSPVARGGRFGAHYRPGNRWRV